MIIYKITCQVTRFCYIGQTFHSAQKRFNDHIKGRGSRAVYSAIQEHGIKSLRFEILHDNINCLQKMNELEIAEIASHDSYKNGYNEHPGGQGKSRLSPAWEHSVEICRLYTHDLLSMAEIAEIFGTTKSRIGYILKSKGITAEERIHHRKRKSQRPINVSLGKNEQENTMHRISLQEACKLTELSESTLRRHIKSGKVSADRDERGHMRFDVAELQRVYGELKNTGDDAQSVEQGNDNAMTGHDREREIALLENQVADLKTQLEKTESQLDTATTEKAQLLDLLSAEKEEKRVIQEEKKALMPPVDDKPKSRNWLLRLVGAR